MLVITFSVDRYKITKLVNPVFMTKLLYKLVSDRNNHKKRTGKDEYSGKTNQRVSHNQTAF